MEIVYEEIEKDDYSPNVKIRRPLVVEDYFNKVQIINSSCYVTSRIKKSWFKSDTHLLFLEGLLCLAQVIFDCPHIVCVL